MNPVSVVTAKSLAKQLRAVLNERGISPYDLALKIGVDKSKIYRILKANQEPKNGQKVQEWVQIKTVVDIAKALDLQYKIDDERNVILIKEEYRLPSDNEPRLIDLKKEQLKESLDKLNEENLLSLERILDLMQQGKFDAHERKNLAEVNEG